MRKEQQTSGLQRQKHKRQSKRQNAANRAAPVSDPSPVQSELLSASQARQVLGVSARAFRNHITQHKITPAAKTPGGHWRFRRQDLETFQAPAQASPVLRLKREKVGELNLALQEKRATMALRELTGEERRRAEQEKEERRTRAEQARRVQRDAAAEVARREQEQEQARAAARVEQDRQDWAAEWIRHMLRGLPRAIPPTLKLEVIDALRDRLPELYETSAGNAEDVVWFELRTLVEKMLRPWLLQTQRLKAANEAINELSVFARGSFGEVGEWESRAREDALAAIDALPETATREQMATAARSAGRHVNREFEAAEEEARQAQEKTRRDLAAEAARREREREQARAADRDAQEAQRASARLEADVKKHLDRVFSYLSELQADPNGWDFEGKLYEYATQISEDIKADLREDLPLDFLAGRRRVQELVDKWLESHCS
jgi:Helix-turn-helix domain